MDKNNESEFMRIAILENTIEAQVVESILSERNIPHQIRSYHDTAFDGLFQVQKGWGNIYAPVSYEEEILEIINEIRSGNHD